MAPAALQLRAAVAGFVIEFNRRIGGRNPIVPYRNAACIQTTPDEPWSNNQGVVPCMPMNDAAAPMNSRGVVYMAIGERFVLEALVSANSMRRHLRLPCTIFTNHPEIARESTCFEKVIEIIPSGPLAHRDKLVAMRASPYHETLFLDTDTYIGAPMDDCWQLLERFDLAASGDRGYVDRFPVGTGVPDSFKELNLGVVFFRRSDGLDRLFEESIKLYDEFSKSVPHFIQEKSFYDQPPFRILLYRSNLRFTNLTDEDNCRFANYGKLNGPVRVLHGRLKRGRFDEVTLSRLLARLNATTVPRVFVAGIVIALWPRRFKWLHNYRPRRMPDANLIDVRLLFERVMKRLQRLSK